MHCICEPGATPQVLFDYAPDKVFTYAIECPYCGKSTNWHKTEYAAIKVWRELCLTEQKRKLKTL